MAECGHCEREMHEAESCTGPETILLLGTEYERYRLGEHEQELARQLPSAVDDKPRCADCGVTEGGLHHPRCDWERCPICDGQLLSCHHIKLFPEAWGDPVEL